MQKFIAFILSSVVIAWTAFGIDNYPPLTADRAEQEKFLEQVMAKYPWAAASGVAASMKNLLGKEQAFLPGMFALDAYKQLKKERPHFVTVHVERLQEKIERVSVIPPEILQRIKQETLQTLEKLQLSEDLSLTETLDKEIAERLNVLGQSDPKGILTGMINSLPPAERGNFFRLPSSQEQLHQLLQNPALTDEGLQANFRLIDGISKDQVSREFLGNHVAKLLAQEDELVPLLRARWFLNNVAVNDTHALEQTVLGSPSEAFDINQASVKAAESFFEKLVALLGPRAKDVTHRTQNYLQKVEKTWRAVENTFEERKVKVGVPYFTIQEIPAYLAVHRSSLTGDCGTTDDFPYPYSPLERNFFVFDDKNKALGYVGSTYINTNGELTLYFHDVWGGAIAQGMRDLILNAMHQVLPEFGVKKMTLSGTGYAPYKGVGNIVQNQYLDREIRTFLNAYARNPHGDRPEDNKQSYEFLPQAGLLNAFLIRLEGANTVAELKKPETPKDALLLFLDLNAGRPLHEMRANPGLLKQPQPLLEAFNNTAHLSLAEYYARMERILKEHDIAISEKFIKRHENYFFLGHLQAQDALTTRDEDLRDRSVAFVINAFKKGMHVDLAYDLVTQHRDVFSDSPKFREFIANTPLIGAEQFSRLRKFIAIGIDASIIAPYEENLLAMTKTPDPHLQTWAIKQFAERKNTKELPPEMVAGLAAALANDKHETDDTSLMAAELLSEIRTDDANVIKSLGKSVSREENLDIAVYAVSALVRSGVGDEEIARLIQKNKGRELLTERLKARGGYVPVALMENLGCENVLQPAP